MREIIIAANWKMNTTPAEGVALVDSIAQALPKSGEIGIVIAPPMTHLGMMAEPLRNAGIGVASQNVHWAASGAYTGEVSASMLTSLSVGWVITGHSERRKYFAETDESVQARTLAALAGGLRPIVCIGETLEERESGATFSVLKRQVQVGLKEIALTGRGGLVIAYEPVWAIGTGRNATSQQAQEAHRYIRELLAKMSSESIANDTAILYGGSVTDSNAAELLGAPDVDGALVGGASLDPLKFGKIVRAAVEAGEIRRIERNI